MVDEVNDYEKEYIEYMNQDDDEIQSSLDEMKEIFGSDEEMKGAFSKLIKAASDLAEISRALKKEPVKSLGIIDYNLLEIDRGNYDAEEEKKLNIEKSDYAVVKYTNEHPTPWMFDYHLESVDGKAFDCIIEKGYITKVMPDKFPELFESYTVEELIRESESYHDPNTPKEELIKDFQEEAYYSWIVSEKGLNYLEKYPFLDFFTNNLLEFNIYEFKLFADKFDGVLDFDEIGDKYINAKLTKALSDNELDMYLYYVDYYFNLYYSKNEYDAALKYLIQRIIYELNTWHLKERHVPFDEPLSIRTDYLLFKITKLNIDFDLESIYDNAYNSLKIDDLKFKYDENYSHMERLMADEDIYDIGDELLEKALGK